jgi:hypothetical protein
MRGKLIALGVIVFMLAGAVSATASDFPTPEQQLHLRIHALPIEHLCCRADVQAPGAKPTPQQQQNPTIRVLPAVLVSRSTNCSTERLPVVATALGWDVFKWSQTLHWCWTSNGVKVTTNPSGNHSCWTALWSFWTCGSYTQSTGGGQGQPYAYIRGDFSFNYAYGAVSLTQYHFASISGRPLGYAIYDWN